MIVYYGFHNYPTNRDFTFSYSRGIEPLNKTLIRNMKELSQGVESSDYNLLVKCPAFKNYLRNTYVVTSPFDYDLSIRKEGVSTKHGDQNLFDSFIKVRDPSNMLFTMCFLNILVFPDSPVDVIQQHALYSSGDISKKLKIVPGRFDPHRHPRPLESAYFAEEYCDVEIKEGDALYYLKFETDAHIEFKEFYVTDRLTNHLESMSIKRSLSDTVTPLSKWYQNSKQMKISKKIQREILNNLVH